MYDVLQFIEIRRSCPLPKSQIAMLLIINGYKQTSTLVMSKPIQNTRQIELTFATRKKMPLKWFLLISATDVKFTLVDSEH